MASAVVEPITVRELCERVELAVSMVAGGSAIGLARTTVVPRIQKPGLALTGWPEQLHDSRVLVLGATEIAYLADHERARIEGLVTLFASDPACVVVCRGCAPPVELVAAATAHDVALLVSSLSTADFIAHVTAWMADRLAPSTEIHGVLLDVLGVGVLVTGPSGIGKSETALDLIAGGHRFVADDVIRVNRRGDEVVGGSSGIIGHHMEIRGLGIINIRDLFGVAAVRQSKKVELVVELCDWNATEEYDRLGFDDLTQTILGVEVATVRIPVRPGRNVATIVEVAARNQLVKVQGIHSARAFRDRLHDAMGYPAVGHPAEALESPESTEDSR